VGAGSFRGRGSGLGHLEFGSGLLSNRWCAAGNPSGEQQPQKNVQPPAKEKHPNTVDSYNLVKQIVVCQNREYIEP
jgi:hypothetical protein